MPSDRKFYKTVVTIEILSQEPYDAEDLEDISANITEGDCSGRISMGASQQIDASTAAKELMTQGSTPDFFNLDENGNEIEEETE